MTRPLTLCLTALAALAACAPAAPPSAGLGVAGRPFRAPPIGPVAASDALLVAAHPRLGPSRGLAVAESVPAGEELAFATAILTELQGASFAGNREFCGYLGLDPAGDFVATPAMPGTEASCPLPPVPAGMIVMASYHTHGTYSPFYASEWPTTQDMLTDASDGIDGYIATPGGRLWHVDSDTMTVRQLCGRGCLPQDPAYVAAEDGPLRPLLTYRDLLAWENG